MTELLTEKEMAEKLKRSVRTLKDWRYRKLVPFIRIRGTTYYDPKSVFAMLKKLERGVAA